MEADEEDMPVAVRAGFIDEGDDGCGEELDEPGMRDWLSVYRIDSGWVTNFPPPDGYLGLEEGIFGLDPTYRRTLTDRELDAVEARQAARIEREAAIARRLYAEAFPVAEIGGLA